MKNSSDWTTGAMKIMIPCQPTADKLLLPRFIRLRKVRASEQTKHRKQPSKASLPLSPNNVRSFYTKRHFSEIVSYLNLNA